MNKPSTRNDLAAPVPKFCFGLEANRRTPEGRVRTAEEFLTHFFPHDTKSCTDRVFRLMPSDVRAPILTTWGVRGKKSAFRDDDGKVQSVVHDALVAGDVDANMFETALSPDIFMRWVDLADWWTFWRAGKIVTHTILKALESAYHLGLFDADWFLDTLRSNGGKLRGTDVLAEGLSKADLTEWVRNIHQTQDGSARGLITALGWDQIAAKTADEVLIAVLDALAIKVSLVEGKAESPTESRVQKPEAVSEPKAAAEAKQPERKPETKLDAAPERKPEIKVEAPAASPEPKPETKVEAKPIAAPRTDLKLEVKPAAAVAPAPDPKAVTDAPTVKPGVLLPWIGIQEASKEEHNELAFDEDTAGGMKEDDLIPISTPGWDDGEDIEVDTGDAGAARAVRRSKPPNGKRPSRSPPVK